MESLEFSTAQSPAVTDTIASLYIELDQQIIRPPAGDQRIASFSIAMLEMLDDSSVLQSITEALQHRVSISGSYAANLLLRSFQKQFSYSDSTYPLAFNSPNRWKEAITAVLHSPECSKELHEDLAQRNVQSNVSERYKSLKLILSIYEDRIGDMPKILDVGCSQNHGLKRLASNTRFSPVTADTVTDTIWVNNILESPVTIGPSLGTDIISPSQDSALWAKNCSFYPSELLNDRKVNLYDRLEQSHPQNVSFIPGDFLKNEFSEQTIGMKSSFEIVFASTFMYQLSKEDRITVRNKLREYVSPNGIIVYQDFLKSIRAILLSYTSLPTGLIRIIVTAPSSKKPHRQIY